MSTARFPQLAHWGAYTALVENGRLVACEPFARDPAMTLAALMQHVPGPDFPTAGIINGAPARTCKEMKVTFKPLEGR